MPRIERREAAGADREFDAIAAVAAHRAMNSLAFIAGALAALQDGTGIGPEEEQHLLSRAITHTGFLNAVLHDLVLGLPVGCTSVAEDDPATQAARRFGLGYGVSD
ncbi:MAG: hypothetical protein NVSMB12_02210 [Acidimicrobiales bacterium]